MRPAEATPEEKEIRAKKMMLWFGIISIVMTFGGLTSAYIVRSSEEDFGCEPASSTARRCSYVAKIQG